jgi:hypothetical protein
VHSRDLAAHTSRPIPQEPQLNGGLHMVCKSPSMRYVPISDILEFLSVTGPRGVILRYKKGMDAVRTGHRRERRCPLRQAQVPSTYALECDLSILSPSLCVSSVVWGSTVACMSVRHANAHALRASQPSQRIRLLNATVQGSAPRLHFRHP